MAHVLDHQHRPYKTDRTADGTLHQAICACGHRGPARDTVLGAQRALEYPPTTPAQGPAETPPDPTFLARTRLTQAVAADLTEEPW